ncbi:MAG: right-handed parallel beta-helix repeat-containing protein, partial [Candidatus Nanoarchaeia archaeon]
MKRFIATFAFISFLCTPGLAKDWYVRPAGGNYGSEDGTSYANAWDGLLNVVWGEGGVQPGDTLYVCGLHIHDMTNWGYIATQADIPVISGTSESNRVIIRGDYPDDPGIVWGSYKISYNPWILIGSSTYRITLVGNHYEDWFFEDITASSWVVLDRKTSLAACQANAGSFYYDKSNNYLYVHCSDNGDPTGRIYANRFGYQFVHWGKQYIKFLNLKLYNHGFSFPDSAPSSYITIQGCTLRYGEARMIGIETGNDHIIVDGCTIRDAGNGIYAFTGASDPSGVNYCEFKNNTIHNIGIRAIQQNSDAHGIGLMDVNNTLIEGNHIYNCGTGITFYAWEYGSKSMKNNTVRYNYIHDNHTYGGANNRGIEFNCDNDHYQDASGNVCYGNILANLDIGIRVQLEDEVQVFNN